MMLWYDDNMGWWGYAGMGIGMVSFWALLIVGIVALVRYTATDRPTPPFPAQPPTPEQVLADRFARGEIDRRGAGPRGHDRPGHHQSTHHPDQGEAEITQPSGRGVTECQPSIR
jgi:putative membrane protein